ncbi:MAG: UDP-N-acetylmuramoyl-L-alanyl-D-glutamate--2,6-diaminopimelate ligase [Microlunatus sp.]
MGAADNSAGPNLRPTGLAGLSWSELLGAVGSAEVVVAPGGRATGELRCTGVTADSRLVQAGDLYVAVPGASRHGADFTAEALRRGARAVLTDAAGAERVRLAAESVPTGPATGSGASAGGVPVAVVPQPRSVIPVLADQVYDHPATRLKLYGITGTNGKTTTAYLLQAVLRAAGQRVGLIGTIGYQLDDRRLESRRTTVTTPEAAELYALLAVLVEQGADAVVMEVSSHALALGRVDGLRFDVAAFTNFGSDHLDFHHDLDSYFAAKASLFTRQRAARAVINLDDPRGRQLIDQAGREGMAEVRTVSLDGPADYAAPDRRPAGKGRTALSVRTPHGVVPATIGLPGEFNVRNAVTALAMADLAGIELTVAAAGLRDAVVPGRMQRIALGATAPAVFVDFAHTPQAVAAVLASLAGHRRIVVLGCGGDRDTEKRAPMGAAAVAGAELVVVTDDNPRTEEPATIRAEVLRGAATEVARSGRDVTVVDEGSRRDAIRVALRTAGPDDVVAILGKGHERGQEIAGTVVPFADEDAVREIYAELSDSAVARATTESDKSVEGGVDQ